MRAYLAHLDPRALRLEAQPLDRHHAGERAARPRDVELAAHLALRALERPLQAALGGEEPHERRDRADEERGDKRACSEEKGAQAQKPYPTEKCRRQSLRSAP